MLRLAKRSSLPDEACPQQAFARRHAAQQDSTSSRLAGALVVEWCAYIAHLSRRGMFRVLKDCQLSGA